jgi:hypothetical protein
MMTWQVRTPYAFLIPFRGARDIDAAKKSLQTPKGGECLLFLAGAAAISEEHLFWNHAFQFHGRVRHGEVVGATAKHSPSRDCEAI